MNEMDPYERLARQIAAWKMGLVKDRQGLNLPDDLWKQELPAARLELNEIRTNLGTQTTVYNGPKNGTLRYG